MKGVRLLKDLLVSMEFANTVGPHSCGRLVFVTPHKTVAIITLKRGNPLGSPLASVARNCAERADSWWKCLIHDFHFVEIRHLTSRSIRPFGTAVLGVRIKKNSFPLRRYVSDAAILVWAG